MRLNLFAWTAVSFDTAIAKPKNVKHRSVPPPPAATDYIPCTDPCDGGDVNYELVSSVRTFPLMNYTYRGRTYSTDGGGSDGADDVGSFMGPTMRVKPGQSLWIKFKNDMRDGTIGPKDPTAVDYWRMLQKPGTLIHSP